MILLVNLIYIAFCILLQLLVEIESQSTISKPSLREAHTATFINDKLYILSGGGTNPRIRPKETFLYLDVSVPFNTNELTWNDLSDNNIIPQHRFAASIKGGANSSTLFLCGGEILVGVKGTMALVYTFDPQSNSWEIPAITGPPPSKVIGTTLTIDNNGLIYLFSGFINNNYLNDMFILDSINLNWKKASSISAPTGRTEYGAVFLPNKNIIYMGGFNQNTVGVLSLDEIFLYDTINDVWNVKKTNGITPSPRSSFSSVLGLDGQRIIMFGGLENNSTSVNPENALYVLDLNNFSWYIPRVPGNLPSSRAFHKTVIIGKYMVVTFGSGYTQGIESDILLLDISNNDEYIWTTSFDPSSLSSTPLPTSTTTNTVQTITTNTTPSSSSSPSNPAMIVGAVVGSLLGGILLTVGSFFLYKWYKNKKEWDRAIPTSGEKILQIPSSGGQILQIPSSGGQILRIPSSGGQRLQIPSSRGEILRIPGERTNDIH